MTTATSNKAAWQEIQSKVQSMTGITCLIGEPTDPPSGITAALIPEGGHVDETTLTDPREVHRIQLRFYAPAFAEPKENTEFILDGYRAQIMADLYGAFTLGGTIAYLLPAQFTWTYGYQTIAQTMFRLLDIPIAYRVDDNAVFAP